MEIVGIVTAVFTDKNTGKVTKTVKGCNHVQDNLLKGWSGQSSGYFNTPLNIVMSSIDFGRQRRDVGILSGRKDGTAVIGLPNNDITYNAEPGMHVLKIARQFSYPTSDTTYRSAGLHSSAEHYQTWAAVRFNAPCVQTTSENLTVYYQIQVRFDADWVNSTDTNVFTEREATYVMDRFKGGQSPLDAVGGGCPFAKLNPRKLQSSVQGYTSTSVTGINRPDMYRPGYRSFIDIDKNIGSLAHSLFTAKGTFGYEITNIPKAPLQGAFGHNNASDKPFYNAAAASAGTGKIAFNADTYVTGDLAEFVKLDVITTGATGVSAYKFSVLDCQGFLDNTYTQRAVVPPLFNSTNSHLLGEDLSYANSPYVTHEYDNFKVLMLKPDTLMVANLAGTDITKIDNTYILQGDVLPKFTPTNITQVEVDTNKDLWVSCSDTGIYYLSADFLTITHIDSSTAGLTGVLGCLGVCRGYNNRLWAYFTHNTTDDLYYSDDEGVNWTAAGYATVVACKGIQVDRDHADGHVLIMHPTGSDLYGTWWDQSTLIATSAGIVRHSYTSYAESTYKSGYAMYFFRNVRCYKGVWCDNTWNAGGRIMVFGNSSRIGGANVGSPGCYAIHPVDDENGNPAFIAILSTFYNIVLVRADGTFIGELLQDSSQYYYTRNIVPLGKNKFLSRHSQTHVTPYYKVSALSSSPTSDPLLRNLMWTDYGWDGSAWVKDHAGSKPTHALAEELLPGFTVAFDDVAGNVDAFLDTDHYTVGLYDGVWMDGATSYDFEHRMYYKPTKVETSVETTPLPATIRDSNNVVEAPYMSSGSWTDNTNTLFHYEGLENFYLYSNQYTLYQCRTASPVIRCTVPQMINVFSMESAAIYDLKGYTQFTVEAYFHGHVGLTTATGGVFDPNSLRHVLSFDRVVNGDSTVKVSYVESGIARASANLLDYNSGNPSMAFRFIITHKREMLVEYYYGGAWNILYQSTINHVILSDYYLEVFRGSGTFGGSGLTGQVKNFRSASMEAGKTNRYLYLGNGLDEGVFSTEFFAVDPDYIKIFIDGIEAVNVGENDTATVLAANSYSVFPRAGVIRYSSNDVGKAVTAEYTTITDS